jgi:hypothetical protein
MSYHVDNRLFSLQSDFLDGITANGVDILHHNLISYNI